MHTEETPQVHVVPADKEKIKKIWKTAGILALITAIEFLIAFTVPHQMEMTRIVVFILLTLVKAAYIVAEFMHLKYEHKVLMWSILIPTVFIVWMMVAFIYEGDALLELRF